jgi:hypothetical protein
MMSVTGEQYTPVLCCPELLACQTILHPNKVHLSSVRWRFISASSDIAFEQN